jgi:aerobic carbon-monoxide dehydrogenase medium subunit
MYAFNYHRADSVKDAVAALREHPEAKLIAGGMTFLPTLKLRLAQPSDLIDLGRIGALKGIKHDGKALEIGAMTTHAEVAESADVRSAIPALSALAGHIGDAQVRNRGTIGGSVANSDPAADYPAALVALGATVHTDRRSIAADDFFLGMFETALERDEIVTRVSFPIPERAGYAKFPNPASRYAVVGVMVAKSKQDVRVGVTGAAASVFRASEMEAALGRNFTAAALAGIAVAADGLNEDLHASAEYRAHLVGVMARRALAAAGA